MNSLTSPKEHSLLLLGCLAFGLIPIWEPRQPLAPSKKRKGTRILGLADRTTDLLAFAFDLGT